MTEAAICTNCQSRIIGDSKIRPLGRFLNSTPIVEFKKYIVSFVVLSNSIKLSHGFLTKPCENLIQSQSLIP